MDDGDSVMVWDSGVGDLIQTDKIMNAETQSLIHNAIPFGKHLIGCKDSVNWKQHDAIPKFFLSIDRKNLELNTMSQELAQTEHY